MTEPVTGFRLEKDQTQTVGTLHIPKAHAHRHIESDMGMQLHFSTDIGDCPGVTDDIGLHCGEEFTCRYLRSIGNSLF